jgi:hypothetical protein
LAAELAAALRSQPLSAWRVAQLAAPVEATAAGADAARDLGQTLLGRLYFSAIDAALPSLRR